MSTSMQQRVEEPTGEEALPAKKGWQRLFCAVAPRRSLSNSNSTSTTNHDKDESLTTTNTDQQQAIVLQGNGYDEIITTTKTATATKRKESSGIHSVSTSWTDEDWKELGVQLFQTKKLLDKLLMQQETSSSMAQWRALQNLVQFLQTQIDCNIDDIQVDNRIENQPESKLQEEEEKEENTDSETSNTSPENGEPSVEFDTKTQYEFRASLANQDLTPIEEINSLEEDFSFDEDKALDDEPDENNNDEEEEEDEESTIQTTPDFTGLQIAASGPRASVAMSVLTNDDALVSMDQREARFDNIVTTSPTAADKLPMRVNRFPSLVGQKGFTPELMPSETTITLPLEDETRSAVRSQESSMPSDSNISLQTASTINSQAETMRSEAMMLSEDTISLQETTKSLSEDTISLPTQMLSDDGDDAMTLPTTSTVNSEIMTMPRRQTSLSYDAMPSETTISLADISAPRTSSVAQTKTEHSKSSSPKENVPTNSMSSFSTVDWSTMGGK